MFIDFMQAPTVSATGSLQRTKERDDIKDKCQRVILGRSGSELFDGVLRISSQKDDHRVELGIVELVHSPWGDVKQSVPALLHQLADGAQADDAGAA